MRIKLNDKAWYHYGRSYNVVVQYIIGSSRYPVVQNLTGPRKGVNDTLVGESLKPYGAP